MEKLSEEIQEEIFLYLTQCGRERRYIIDKSTLSIYNKNFNLCGPTFAFKKEICKNCNSNILKFINFIKYSVY